MKLKPNFLLVLDFDSTLTTKDTLSTIASLAAASSPSPSWGNHFSAYHNSKSTLDSNSSSSSDRISQWQDIVSAYTSDLDRHTKAYLPRKEERFDIQVESAWYASLRHVEAASLERAKKSELFANISTDYLFQGGEEAVKSGHVVLRDGWDKLFLLADHLAIISLNWSRAFIRGCLTGGLGLTKENRESIEQTINAARIFANEIAEPGESTEIYTSTDKLKTLNLVVDGLRDVGLVVYVGDSTTDFDSLLRADYGIAIRNIGPMTNEQRDLAESLGRVKVCVAELSINGHSECREPVVYWTDSLDWIAEFLLLSTT